MTLWRCWFVLIAVLMLFSDVRAFDVKYVKTNTGWSVQMKQKDRTVIQSPAEGLWSIAFAWKDRAPADWRHVSAIEKSEVGNWTILSGRLDLKGSELLLRDSYKPDRGMLKCVRRFEYRGTQPLENVTLSVRWSVSGHQMQAFLPGTLYYGNPSGGRNTPGRTPVYRSTPGEFAYFEEHRYPMPFACLEDRQQLLGAGLHTLPSSVPRGTVPDQYWSLGVRAVSNDLSELGLYSGFIGYNGKNSVAKALQQKPLDYPQTTMTLLPGTIIEKTFYLDLWPIAAEGTAFERPIDQSLNLFKPFYADDLPTRSDILRSKFDYVKRRWLEGPGYAGFNMMPEERAPIIVMGWCGQADSPGFSLQCLENTLVELEPNSEAKEKTRNWIRHAVQASLDHLSTSPVDSNGFSVHFDIKSKQWKDVKDPVSMGQGMYNFAKAIETARKSGLYKTDRWEAFLQKCADSAANRILRNDWHPKSTAEGFYIAPLILSARLFENDLYRRAAIRAGEHFAQRHLKMREPYWGGTLDATCEDKEGAWAAFQGFLTLYEVTGEKKFLDWARHACGICLSYLVVWDIPLPPGRLADHQFKTRGWTSVSVQNQHLDVYGVLFAPEIWKIGKLTGQNDYCRAAEVMFRSCGQLIDPWGSQGEQIQETNFAQRGEMSDVLRLRGGYAETWTVFWITAHFLNSAARQEVMQSEEKR